MSASEPSGFRQPESLSPARSGEGAAAGIEEGVCVAKEFGPSDPVFTALLESLDYGVLLFDREGNLSVLNGRASEILHLDATSLQDRPSYEVFLTRIAPRFLDAETLVARWRNQFERSETSWDEIETLPPVRKLIERFARVVLNEQGKRIGWLEICRDVTTQRMVEAKLLHTDRMVSLGQLVSSIAHELNSPLTSILGYAQLLCSRAGSTGADSEVQQVLDEAERASRIVKNLLFFASGAEPRRSPVKLNEIVERTLALRRHELGQSNIKIETDLDPALLLISGDPGQLQQVFLNLLLNAGQALQQTGTAGHIAVRTRSASSDRIAFEVSDDGPGIPADVLPHIFDPFFTTKQAGVGTGLGLAIVASIVQEHGGEVFVESRLSHGVTFRVELPVDRSSSPQQTARYTAQSGLPTGYRHGFAPPALGSRLPRRQRERILVVEDEPVISRLIADVLSEDGHVVDTVLDSREGLDRAARIEYDLIVCDLRMPHLDGRDFYRELRRIGSPLVGRLVFVTGEMLTEQTVEFLRMTGIPYLAKPFLVEELRHAVYSALTARRQPPADTGARDVVPWRRPGPRRPWSG